jgi:D-glycero-beta-D-manno-heptose-7-phosphate kinase
MNEIRKKLIDTIEHFGDIKVLVIGDVMLDVFEFCHSENSKPIDSEKPGKRAYLSHDIIKELGGAGNVAANLASLQIPVSLIGITGNDEHYHKLIDLAETQNISHFLLQDDSRPTTIKTRLYVDDEYLLRRDDEKTHDVNEDVSNKLVDAVIRELSNCNVVILSDYNKGIFTKENTGQIIQECRIKKIPIVVDFKPENFSYFKKVTVMAPNDNEAHQLMPTFNLDDLETSMKQLYAKLNCEKLIVTLGANGICGFDGTDYFHLPGNVVNVVDAVGCGDTVRAGIAVGLSLGLSLQESAILANDAAAIIVQKSATASISRQELIDFLTETLN